MLLCPVEEFNLTHRKTAHFRRQSSTSEKIENTAEESTEPASVVVVVSDPVNFSCENVESNGVNKAAVAQQRRKSETMVNITCDESEQTAENAKGEEAQHLKSEPAVVLVSGPVDIACEKSKNVVSENSAKGEEAQHLISEPAPVDVVANTSCEKRVENVESNAVKADEAQHLHQSESAEAASSVVVNLSREKSGEMTEEHPTVPKRDPSALSLNSLLESLECPSIRPSSDDAEASSSLRMPPQTLEIFDFTSDHEELPEGRLDFVSNEKRARSDDEDEAFSDNENESKQRHFSHEENPSILSTPVKAQLLANIRPNVSLQHSLSLTPTRDMWRNNNNNNNKSNALEIFQRRKRKRRRRFSSETKVLPLPPPSSNTAAIGSSWGARIRSWVILIPADHPWKIIWDVFTVILTFLSAYVTHISIRDRSYDYGPFVIFAELWFLIDVLLNFVTEHKSSNGDVIRDVESIWGRYLTTWFVVDILSLIPWERIYVKPIVDMQKRRGFFKKSFFRTRAVVRVTRILRGRHFRIFGKVAGQTKRAGVGGKRLLGVIIRYLPKYLMFYRNMRGVLAVRTLRLIHFLRRVFKDMLIKVKGDKRNLLLLDVPHKPMAEKDFLDPFESDMDTTDDNSDAKEFESDADSDDIVRKNEALILDASIAFKQQQEYSDSDEDEEILDNQSLGLLRRRMPVLPFPENPERPSDDEGYFDF